MATNEVVTSTELISRLESNGLTRNNARQMLLRASSAEDLWRSKHLVLEAGARLFCWAPFWGTKGFHQQVEAILKENRRGLHRVLLASRESVVLREEAEKLLASPMTPRRPYPSFDSEVSALVELGALQWEGNGSAIERLSDSRIVASPTSVQKAKARWAERAVASELARILSQQLRRTNFMTWGSVPALGARGVMPFNNQAFDHVGFSRLGPLLRFTDKSNKPSPTPVVFDVHARPCEEYAVEAFLERMKRAGMNKTSRLPMVGVIAAYDFSSDAWRLAKNSALMTVNLRDMFGDAALDAMIAIEQLLQRVGAAQEETFHTNAAEIDKLADLLARVSQNPIVSDLRSLGFEALAGLIISQAGYPDVVLNALYPFKGEDGQQRELDVLGSRARGNELYAVECKAEHASKQLSPQYVTKFFCETVPSMVDAERQAGRPPSSVIAEIWTTGQIGVDAQRAFENLALPKCVSSAGLLDAEAIMKKVPSSLSGCSKLLASFAASSHELSPLDSPSRATPWDVEATEGLKGRRRS